MILMTGMLNEREVEDKECKVRIQLMEADIEFQSERHEALVANNEHKLKGVGGARGCEGWYT